MPKSWFEPLFSLHISERQLNSWWTLVAIVELSPGLVFINVLGSKITKYRFQSIKTM